MKKWISLLLAAVFAAGVSAPVSAAETDAAAARTRTVEVSLDSIEEIMASYNLDLRTYLNNLKIARNNAEDAEDTEQEEAADHALDLAEEEYDQNARAEVLGAKQAYLAYCADNDRIAEAQTAADNAQKSLNAALRALSSGYAAQKDVDDLRQKTDQAQNALTQLDSQLTQEKDALRTLLNLPQDVSMHVKPLTAEDLDLSEIQSINYGGDLIEMRKNSSKIKSAELSYQYEKDHEGEENDGFTEQTRGNAYIALQQARVSEEAAFKKLYDSVNSAYTVYQQDLAQVQRKQSELAFEQKALSLGYSTRQAADAKTQELKTAQTTLADARKALFADYLSYLDMKNGYSAAGAAGSYAQ